MTGRAIALALVVFSLAAALLLLAGSATAASPVAVDDTLTTTQNTAGDVAVLENDVDPDGDDLTVTGNANPAHGTATCQEFGTCTYTPAAGYVGTDSFDYTVSDGTSTATATVAVTVVPNHPPVANDDSAKTAVNTPVTIFPPGNDKDPDNDLLSITSPTPSAAHGSVACDATSCTYTPNAGFTGNDAFDYTVSDGQASDTGTVFVAVGVSAPPVANNDALTLRKNSSATVFVLDNDDDADFDELTLTSNTDPPHGTVVCEAFGSCTYTPETDYVGPDSFDYTVSDGTNTDTATVNIDVIVNRPPVAKDEALVLKRNATAAVFVLNNDTDPDLDNLTVTGNSDAPHGTVACDAFGSCTYTPDTDYVGPDSFDYTVSDGIDADTGTVKVAVILNRPHVAGDDSLTAKQNTPAAVSVLGNDLDADHDVLTLTGHTDPAHGTVSCTPFGACTYTPATDYLGPDSFDYTVTDGEATDTATVNVTVELPCVPAVCINNGTVLLAVRPEGHLNSSDGTGSPAGPGDVGLEFLPTGNDSTSPGCLCEGWGAADATSGITGFANVSVDGVHGMSLVSFSHTASTAVSVVNIQDTLKVTQDYHPSPVTPDLYEVTVTIENVSGHDLGDIRYRRVMDWDIEPTAFREFVTINTGNASELMFDSDDGFATANPLGARSNLGNTGSFVDKGPADHGALFDFGFGALGTGQSKTFNIFYGAAANEVDALAAVNAVGSEVFSFGQPSTPDGPTLGTPNTFIFAFGGVGGTPIFSPDAVDDTLTTPMNTPGMVNVLANDTDPNGDALTVTSLTPSAAHGTVACTAAGACTYAPNAGYVGPDSFDYTISDGHGGSDTATVHVTVTAVNRAPVALDGTLTTDRDIAQDVTLVASDPDGDALTYTIVTGPSHGSLSGTGATRIYTPDLGYVGPDSFTFKANDGLLDSNTATVTITVRHVNHAPVAQDGTLTTDQDVAKDVTLVASDPDGDALTYTIVTGPAHGTLGGTGATRTYTPNAGYSGPDSFTFKADDGTVDSNVATITITVRHVNHAPVAQDGTLATDQDLAKPVTLQASDPDGDALTYTIVSQPQHGLLSGIAPALTYTPNAGYSGPDAFTFKANDGTLDSNTATITITVRHVNHAPHANDLTVATDENTPVAVTLTGSDPDGDLMTFATSSSPAHGSLSGSAPNLTYTPNPGYSGLDSFTYKANDGTLDSNTATVTITVHEVVAQGPRVDKQEALAALRSLLPTGDQHDDEKLEAAIEHLAKSLDPELWSDDSHLTRRGKTVFKEEKKTVDHLRQLEDPPALVGTVMDTLVEVDRVLARTAIADADPMEDNVQKLAEAENHMKKAAEALAKGHLAQAIEHYGHAWKKAQQALR